MPNSVPAPGTKKAADDQRLFLWNFECVNYIASLNRNLAPRKQKFFNGISDAFGIETTFPVEF